MKAEYECSLQKGSSVKLTVTISKREVDDVMAKVLKKYTKSVQVPGFRKGKTPAKIMRNKYGESLREETVSELIDLSFKDIISDEELKYKPLMLKRPEVVETSELMDGEDFKYTVLYDVYPDIEVHGLEKVELVSPVVNVSEDDIQQELLRVQERNALVMDRDDTMPCENGDSVVIDFWEIKEDNSKGVVRKDYTFIAGKEEERFSPCVVGMKRGEEKEAELSNEDGEKTKYGFKVKAVRERRIPALDDELAKDVSEKYKTLSDLKAAIKHQLEDEVASAVNTKKQNELLEKLVLKNEFEVPHSMLEAEFDRQWASLSARYGVNPEEFAKKTKDASTLKEEMFKNTLGDLERNVRAQIIVAKLIEDKKITVAENELEAEYKKIAENADTDVERVKKYYTESGSEESLIYNIKRNKLFEDLYKEVKVTEGKPVNVKEFFNS